MTSTNATFSPSIDEIRGAVTDEIIALGGSVSDLVTGDSECLFMRTILPASAEVRVGDSMQPGVAVRAVRAQVEVYPYMFRQVCSNGSIIANAIPGRQIERIAVSDIGVPSYDGNVILGTLRDAVRECTSPAAFGVIMEQTRAMGGDDSRSHGLHMLRMLARMHSEEVIPYLRLIFGRFATSDDQSAFGVMNAVTSIARDTADPEIRWSLEQIGGSMPAYLARRARVKRGAVAPANTETEVLV